MANASELKIRVSADTADAEKKLDDVAKAAEAVSDAAASTGGVGAAAGAGASAAGAGTAQAAAVTISGSSGGGGADRAPNASGNGAGASNMSGSLMPAQSASSTAKMSEELGKSAGVAIGKYFIAQFGIAAANLAIEYSRKAGGGNTAQDYAQAGLNGAVQGAGTAGALGFMLGGPLGAGVGVAIGSVLGGAIGLAGMNARKRMEVEQQYRSRLWSKADSEYDLEESLRSQAFEGIIGTMGTAGQAKAMRNRAAEIRRGFGNTSVAQLSIRLAEMERNGKSDTDVYSRLKTIYDSQLRAANDLERRAAGVEQTTLMGSVVGGYGQAANFADDMARRGISVGAQVDTFNVQNNMLTELREIRNTLRSVAGQGGFSRSLGQLNSYYGF